MPHLQSKLDNAASDELRGARAERYQGLTEAEDHTRNPTWLRICKSHALKFEAYYAEQRLKFSSDTISPWDSPHSWTLARYIEDYLFYLLHHTRGSTGTQRVSADTMRWWAKAIVYAASDKVLGAGSRRNHTKAHVVHGSLPNKSFSIWSLVVEVWVPIMILEFELKGESRPIDFWEVDHLEQQTLTTETHSEAPLAPPATLDNPQDRSSLADAGSGPPTTTQQTSELDHTGQKRKTDFASTEPGPSRKRHAAATHKEAQDGESDEPGRDEEIDVPNGSNDLKCSDDLQRLTNFALLSGYCPLCGVSAARTIVWGIMEDVNTIPSQKQVRDQFNVPLHVRQEHVHQHVQRQHLGDWVRLNHGR